MASRVIPPSDPSSGWPRRSKNAPFKIKIPSHIQNLSSLSGQNVKTLCQTDRSIAARQCIMCDERPVTQYTCLVCGDAPYCSAGCRLQDSVTHRLLCQVLHGYFIELRRPGENYFQALIFLAQDANPVTRWVKMHRSRETGEPALLFQSGEFWSLATQFDKKRFKGFNLGCVNLGTSLRHKRLGKGLFILEWALNPDDPRQRDLDGAKWINKSIAALGKPGHIWYYTGPVIVLAIDPQRSIINGKKTSLALLDITHHDVRSVIDFFQHHMRNPCLTDPHDRYPAHLLASWGLKLNDVSTPLARLMGVTKRVEAVKVATHHAGMYEFRNFQGISELLDHLDLKWVFRTGLLHGPEFNWMSQPPDARPQRWNPLWRRIKVLTEHGDAVGVVEIVSHADSIVMLHPTGNVLHPTHLCALSLYFPYWQRSCLKTNETLKKAETECADKIEVGKAGFERYWSLFKYRYRIDPFLESPWQTERESLVFSVRICGKTLSVLRVEEKKLEAKRRGKAKGKRADHTESPKVTGSTPDAPTLKVENADQTGEKKVSILLPSDADTNQGSQGLVNVDRLVGIRRVRRPRVRRVVFR